MSNNSLVSIPQHIYKWQSLTSLVLQNNNIKNFPPELGFLNLKTINIAGNPTMLLKNNSANKGAAALMNYLRERVADKAGMEKEVAQLQNNLRDRQKTVGNPLPKKPTDLQEYEFLDPFKKQAVEYNKKHDEQFGEVYEEDVKNYLEAKRSPQSMDPHRMDEETPSKGFGRGAAHGSTNNARGYQESQGLGSGFGNNQQNTRTPVKMDEERPLPTKQPTRMEPETPEIPEVAGKIGSRFNSNQKYGEGMGIIGGSPQFVSNSGIGATGGASGQRVVLHL